MGADFSSIRITEGQASRMISELYGLKGEVVSLPGELDFNFRIRSGTSTHLFKVSRPGVDLQHVEFQQGILDHLSRSNPEVELPLTITDLRGRAVGETTDDMGRSRIVRLYSWIEGRIWSEVNPIGDPLLFSLGEKTGALTRSLQGFDHPWGHREFDWDVSRGDWTRDHLHLFSGVQRSVIDFFQDGFSSSGGYSQLRKGVVHNDANDNNIIVTGDLIEPRVKAIIDFGDAVYTQVINDLAITIAYAVMGKPDPLSAALPVVKGYHSQFPLQEEELEYLYHLVAMRLVISVTKSAINKEAEPGNRYLLISEKPAWDLLGKWKQVKREFAHFSFRNACGFSPHPLERGFKQWSDKQDVRLSSLFPTLQKERVHHLDLGLTSPWTGHYQETDDLVHFQYRLDRIQSLAMDRILAGGYLEPRIVYTTPAYDKQGNAGRESRTIHLGIDLWVPSGTPVHTLFDGVVVTAVNDAGDKEYGGLVILRHLEGKVAFHTLHGHLSPGSIEKIRTGQSIRKGECIGLIGQAPENGNWAPHLHFQVMLSTLEYADDFPGVAFYRQTEVWRSICPDPNFLFKDPALKAPVHRGRDEVISFRQKHLGKSLSLSYKEPIKIVRGAGVHLIDETGRRYLDTVNNVAHVGHEHPAVVKAGQQQMALLNTNTRYLHDNINEFAKELLSTFPGDLSVVHVVNSGSEANELALRMARTITGNRDMIAVEVGYHGNTTGCVDVSSYKFDGKGGKGAPEHTHIVPLPDSYRGIYKGQDTGPRYALHIKEQVDHIQSLGRNVAGFICESIISCGGQIELPDGYLQMAYESVRRAGGVCIADEVQVGCGRVGSAFWGFQLHGVVPDIVTIGKPIGNGHPLAAVVCTREVADAFANGMEYFNTFGGNPVSCAIGLEVLRVIRQEELQKNALDTGNYLKAGLMKMQDEFPVIGEIRGQGLFLGVELADRSMNPLTRKAAYLIGRMKELGVLMSTDGKDDNVIKIKPPMVFSMEEADRLLSELNTVMQEDFMVQ